MKSFNTIYQLSFYLVTLITFVFGGAVQFLFGVSNTVLTFLITAYVFLIYLIYALLKHRVVFNWVIFFSMAYVSLILLTAVIRQSDFIATITYLIFPLLPLAVYLFGFINYKEGYISFQNIFKVFYYIALIQLPVLLIQKRFYDVLIGFNNSNQKIEWFDFMFGTFFIKSDHSLGVFILIIIAIILFRKEKVKNIVKWRSVSVLYLAITLFMTESNISKLFLVVLLSTIIIIPFYKKYARTLRFKIGVGVLALAILSAGYTLRDKDFIIKRLGGTWEQQFSLKNAERFYELRTAKRFHIVMVAYSKIKTKWIGDGPYSYFDIRTGKFKQTRHFTQLIWTYYDLGLFGLFIVFAFILSLIGYLDVDKGLPFLFFLGIFIVYSFYTTMFSDIAIIFSVFLLFNKSSQDKINP
ncbi:hypothetical protein KCTC52924_01307 [Arenibacter antarcticus]|uniref:O-antigen ligase like membrane protein n=1 Tax=Arenibacter antarcticus TaxID=2040469 RepID=A0ABW5VAV1_9FLAO|nr:hypothetical protein [Arenibacter sp. H213]MCM4167876.1 hypothetical protein [Arenibacter sp. H213]